MAHIIGLTSATHCYILKMHVKYITFLHFILYLFTLVFMHSTFMNTYILYFISIPRSIHHPELEVYTSVSNVTYKGKTFRSDKRTFETSTCELCNFLPLDTATYADLYIDQFSQQ